MRDVLIFQLKHISCCISMAMILFFIQVFLCGHSCSLGLSCCFLTVRIGQGILGDSVTVPEPRNLLCRLPFSVTFLENEARVKPLTLDLAPVRTSLSEWTLPFSLVAPQTSEHLHTHIWRIPHLKILGGRSWC